MIITEGVLDKRNSHKQNYWLSGMGIRSATKANSNPAAAVCLLRVAQVSSLLSREALPAEQKYRDGLLNIPYIQDPPSNALSCSPARFCWRRLLPAAKISVLAAVIDLRISALGLLDPVDNTGDLTALHVVTTMGFQR